MRAATALAWAILITLLGVGTVQAEKRVALVIGNGAYQHADRLANTLIDARRMRDKLASLGFEVVFGGHAPSSTTRFGSTVMNTSWPAGSGSSAAQRAMSG